MPTGEEIARAITNTMARLRAITDVQQMRLFDLLSAEDCPDRFVHELAAHYGFDDVLEVWTDVQDRADAVDIWRRVVQFAATELWSTKGEHNVTTNVLRLFCQCRSFVGDWFSFRTVLAPAAFPWFATAAIAVDGQYWTEVHVEDWDGALDRDLAEHSLDLIRGQGERFNITFVDGIENWRNGWGRWTRTSGTAEIDTDNGTVMVLGPDAASASVIDMTAGDQTGWDAEVYNAVISIPTGSSLRWQVRSSAAAHYEVRLVQGVAANNVRLYRTGANVASGTHGIPADTDMVISLQTMPGVGTTGTVLVVVNGTVLITYVDAAFLPTVAQSVQWSVAAGTDVATVVWWEAIGATPEQRTIGA